MKKLFLILLFCVVTFCAAGQVTLSDDQARFYLEQNEKVKVYEKLVPIKDQRIQLLEQKIIQQKIIIGTYENDSTSFRGIINTNGEMLAFKDKQLEAAEKNIKKLKRQRNITAGAGGGALIGSFFGPEGAVVGGVIGGTAGLIISWIRK